jgi:ParB-like chromosome segregation protein Spo0J
VNREGVIIDGFHRWCLSRDSKAIRAKYEGLVPCVEMDIDEGKAMVLTIRINRAKGAHAAIEMSRIVKSLIDEHHWDPAQVALEIGATKDEIDLLYQDDIFKARNLKDHAYSKAWVPYEDGNRHVLK